MKLSGNNVSRTEAAAILGCALTDVARMLLAGHLDRCTDGDAEWFMREQVEQLAAMHWPNTVLDAPRVEADPHYWMTLEEVAAEFRVHPDEVREQARAEELPSAETIEGEPLFRRRQILTVINAHTPFGW